MEEAASASKRKRGKVLTIAVLIIAILIGVLNVLRREGWVQIANRSSGQDWSASSRTASDSSKPQGLAVADPSSQSEDPAAKEEHWLEKNLQPGEFYYALARKEGAAISEVSSEHHAFEVSAIDGDTWQIIVRLKTITTFFPYTSAAKTSTYQEKSTCNVKYKNVSWKHAIILDESAGDPEDEESKKYILEATERGAVDCDVETEYSDQPVQDSQHITTLSIAFRRLQSARDFRDAVAKHVSTDLEKP